MKKFVIYLFHVLVVFIMMSFANAAETSRIYVDEMQMTIDTVSGEE